MEYVWNYPRSPRLEPERRALKVVFAGRTVAETRDGFRVLETSAPPTYYFPPGDVERELLAANPAGSFCEFKGHAGYWDLSADGATSPAAAWSYASPTPPFMALADYFAFYPGRVEACFVGDLCVRPQPGDFYGGWITPDLAGPFKGASGTENW